MIIAVAKAYKTNGSYWLGPSYEGGFGHFSSRKFLLPLQPEAGFVYIKFGVLEPFLTRSKSQEAPVQYGIISLDIYELAYCTAAVNTLASYGFDFDEIWCVGTVSTSRTQN